MRHPTGMPLDVPYVADMGLQINNRVIGWRVKHVKERPQ
ncbi:hypothetical protein BH23GEM6_BH23GEM6_03590 [soil metagenome]